VANLQAIEDHRAAPGSKRSNALGFCRTPRIARSTLGVKLSEMQNSHEARDDALSHRGDGLSYGDDRPPDRAGEAHARRPSGRSDKPTPRPRPDPGEQSQDRD